MPKRVSTDWYQKRIKGATRVTRLHRMVPDRDLPPGYVRAILDSSSHGRPVLLCPVDRVGLLPKCLTIGVQTEFDFVDKDVNKSVLIGPDGSVYYSGTLE